MTKPTLTTLLFTLLLSLNAQQQFNVGRPESMTVASSVTGQFFLLDKEHHLSDVSLQNLDADLKVLVERAGTLISDRRNLKVEEPPLLLKEFAQRILKKGDCKYLSCSMKSVFLFQGRHRYKGVVLEMTKENSGLCYRRLLFFKEQSDGLAFVSMKGSENQNLWRIFKVTNYDSFWKLSNPATTENEVYQVDGVISLKNLPQIAAKFKMHKSICNE
ncbi:hypothetical protein CEQ90_13335 [Lewinellaceae bacterium SD302]|nr:hypothetical protein CEQ90_13335 [Lewinellaceae bacterium SD302]